MELQAWLMLCGVGVAGVAAVLLLMGLFSASGTSYEEAIAQQRKATTELLSLAENKNKAKKKDKKEKKEKKLAKKEKSKENATVATSSDPESEAPAESGMEDDSVPSEKPHVEFRPPVVVDIARDTPPAVKIRKRGKDPKVKPILLNKEDPSCVSDPGSLPPTVPVSNNFEEMHPKDEFELLQSSLATEKVAEKKEEVVEKKDSKASKAAKNTKAAVKTASVEEAAKVEPAAERQASAEVAKEQRKAKKVEKKQSDETSESGKEESVPPLNVPQPSELTTEKLLKQAMAPATAPAPSPPPTKNKKKKPEPNVLTLMAIGCPLWKVSLKLLKQAMAPATAPAPSPPPTKNKKKKPEPNVLTLMGSYIIITSAIGCPLWKVSLKLLKQAMAPATAPAPSPPPTKNKKKKPEPNVLTLMGSYIIITSAIGCPLWKVSLKLLKQAMAPATAPAPSPPPTKNKKKKPEPNVLTLMGSYIIITSAIGCPLWKVSLKLLKQAMAPATAPAPSPPPAKNKKKKPEPNVLTLMAAGDGGGVNVGELVRVIREAALSRTEIQILTDALLNKHHDPLPEHSEWTEGPNDPMQKLKKQLADKEKALADEIEASQALHAKLKELRANLNAERGRAAAATRASEQAAAALRAEQHTLQTRLQRLLDDNHMLAQDKVHLQSKLGVEGEAQAQRVQMEMHIQRLTEAENGLVQQLAALQAELNARIVEAGQARMDAGAARDAMLMAQQHANELAQQLQEANRAYSELEQQRQCAAHAEQLAQQELQRTQERLAATSELQSEVQRLTSRAQTAESSLEKLKEETEKQKQQLSSELASLREQIAAREAELAELKQLKPAQNGLPNNDQHKAAELAKVESVVEALRNELAGAQAASREQRDELARLSDQLAAYQHKNNELRTKNWKVMEALQSAEKALQTKSSSALPAQDALREAIEKAQEAQYNEVASVLRAACPSAAPSTTAGREWLQAFADNLKKELAKKEAEKKELEKKMESSRAAQASDDRLADMQAQNEHLQGLVDKYKRIIEDTEGVLSRLQQHVGLEEARWAQQLADKQRELDDLRARTVLQMQNKIDSLTAELQKAQASGHNNSFADAERLTQERLMAGQSDKLNVDVYNGPLQVGLDSK